MTKAFYSEDNDKAWEHGGLCILKKQDGSHVCADYIGHEVGGYPGRVNEDGVVERPPNHESYIFVGNVGEGALRVVSSQPWDR